ncbi:MAG: T9SS type A sorting domain-containing protein [Bacteroidota bacterium]
MKQATIYALLLGFALPALAQTPNTTSAERYFPLEVGNVWEYEGFDLIGEKPIYQRRTITRDTLVAGQRYFRYDRAVLNEEGDVVGSLGALYVRFDTLATAIRVLEDVPPFDILPNCALGEDFSSGGVCEVSSDLTCEAIYGGDYDVPITIGAETVTASAKSVDTQGCELDSLFVADIGFTQFFTFGANFALRYARVGGAEYGEPFAVVTESGPDTPALALSVYPTPSSGSVTASLSLDEAQQVRFAVYDVLGRRVLSGDLGARPAGEAQHGLDAARLPAGVYLVRLTGDAGAAATARLVRQ